jgi:hypothetical protein
MLLFKACPKCKDDVELSSGMDGEFAKCLMCGFSRDMSEAYRPKDLVDEIDEMKLAS